MEIRIIPRFSRQDIVEATNFASAPFCADNIDDKMVLLQNLGLLDRTLKDFLDSIDARGLSLADFASLSHGVQIAVDILLFSSVVFFFTRPKVKAQFTA